MGNSSQDAAAKLQKELDKAQSLRHDDKAWKKQVENVRKADAEWRQARRQGT